MSNYASPVFILFIVQGLVLPQLAVRAYAIHRRKNNLNVDSQSTRIGYASRSRYGYRLGRCREWTPAVF